jgi:hypothetical protein
MSLIPSGLLASLPASLWPHTATVKKTGISATSDNEDSGAYQVVLAATACRFMPLKAGAAQAMDLYPNATHRIQLRGYHPEVQPTQFAFGDEGDGTVRRYRIESASADGQGTLTTLIVERQGTS